MPRPCGSTATGPTPAGAAMSGWKAAGRGRPSITAPMCRPTGSGSAAATSTSRATGAADGRARGSLQFLDQLVDHHPAGRGPGRVLGHQFAVRAVNLEMRDGIHPVLLGDGGFPVDALHIGAVDVDLHDGNVLALLVQGQQGLIVGLAGAAI